MFLIKRNRVYYLRVRVPHDMVRHFRRGEIVRSLHTGNYKQAKSLAAGILGKFSEVYMMARSTVLTDDMIQPLIQSLIDNTLAFAEKCRVQGGFTPDDARHINSGAVTELSAIAVHDGLTDSGTSYDDATEILRATMNEMKQRIQYRQFDETRVAELLHGAGITASKASPEYQKLCREHLKAWHFISQIELERSGGNYDTPYDIELRSRPKSNKLSEVIQKYRETHNNISQRTKETNEDVFEKILESLEAVTGKRDILLSDIDATLTSKWAARLTKYPIYRYRYKGLTLAEIDKLPNAKFSSVQTATSDVFKLSALFTLAIGQLDGLRKNYMDSNRVQGDADKLDRDSRDVFEPEDLQVIIKELQRRKDKGEFSQNPHLVLVPLIALFQGCRVNEICQLRVADIKREDGVWCLDVTNEGEKQSVKNKNSKRLIPVHPALQEVGLLRFWEQQKRRGMVRLWEGETKISCAYYEKKNSHGHYMSKWFNETFKPGIQDRLTNPPKQSFHSFRHTWLNWFKQNLINYDRAAVYAMSGHIDATDTKYFFMDTEAEIRYEKELNITRQYDTLKLLDYGLDLSGLVI